MRPVRLHVVCGGGTGSSLLRRLHSLGYGLSAGPLSELDDDARTARELGIEAALVPAGGERDATSLGRARALVRDADAVILTPFAVGPGNLVSLTLPRDRAPTAPLFLVLGGEFARRDYTGGEASRLYDELRAQAAATVRSPSDLLPLLAERWAPA